MLGDHQQQTRITMVTNQTQHIKAPHCIKDIHLSYKGNLLSIAVVLCTAVMAVHVS